MNHNHVNWSAIFYFVVSILLVATGLIMLAFDITKVGSHYLTQQKSAIGGYIVIFIGLVGLLVGYYSLSPLGKIRSFFEGSVKTKKRK